MSNIRHSLSLKMIGLVLTQNGIIAALLIYMAEDATATETLVTTGLVIACGVITAALAGRIVGALKTLSGDLPGLAEGRLGITPQHLQRKDEIGTIARELERLSRDNLAFLIEDDKESMRRAKQEAQRDARHAEELDAAIGHSLALRNVVEAIDCATRRFAAGDLSGRLNESFPNEFEGLRADFNHAMTSLQETLDRIETSSRLIRSTCADVKEDSATAMKRGLRQTTAITEVVAEVGSLAEILRARKMQTEHTANIAYNARIDVRGPKDVVHTAARAMAATREASMKIEPVARTIREIAFQANMLAMNVGIEAAHGEALQTTQTSVAGSVATDIRLLAEGAAEAAKEISLLSRQTAEAAELASRSIEKAEGEMAAITIYVDAMKGHIDTIAASSVAEIEKIAAVRLSLLAIAKNGRDQTGTLDAVATRVDRMMREVGAIDHHAGRFTPVTVLTPGSKTIPAAVKPPKRGSHLRLVKS